MNEKQESKRSTARKPYQKPEVVKIRLEARNVVMGCVKYDIVGPPACATISTT